MPSVANRHASIHFGDIRISAPPYPPGAPVAIQKRLVEFTAMLLKPHCSVASVTGAPPSLGTVNTLPTGLVDPSYSPK
jgi:hypothetical protein